MAAKKAKKKPSSTVTLKHLAARVAEDHEMAKKQAEAVFGSVVDLIVKYLTKSDRIRIAGLGILAVGKRAARVGRNPATGEASNVATKRKRPLYLSDRLANATTRSFLLSTCVLVACVGLSILLARSDLVDSHANQVLLLVSLLFAFISAIDLILLNYRVSRGLFGFNKLEATELLVFVLNEQGGDGDGDGAVRLPARDDSAASGIEGEAAATGRPT